MINQPFNWLISWQPSCLYRFVRERVLSVDRSVVERTQVHVHVPKSAHIGLGSLYTCIYGTCRYWTCIYVSRCVLLGDASFKWLVYGTKWITRSSMTLMEWILPSYNSSVLNIVTQVDRMYHIDKKYELSRQDSVDVWTKLLVSLRKLRGCSRLAACAKPFKHIEE